MAAAAVKVLLNRDRAPRPVVSRALPKVARHPVDSLSSLHRAVPARTVPVRPAAQVAPAVR